MVEAERTNNHQSRPTGAVQHAVPVRKMHQAIRSQDQAGVLSQQPGRRKRENKRQMKSERCIRRKTQPTSVKRVNGGCRTQAIHRDTKGKERKLSIALKPLKSLSHCGLPGITQNSEDWMLTFWVARSLSLATFFTARQDGLTDQPNS